MRGLAVIECRGKPEETMPELDRRTFLKTAAGSSVLVTPATLIAQSPQTTPGRPSRGDDTERRERAGGSGGLSKARLGRMHDVMAGYVDRGQVPGLVTLVSRREKCTWM
jgi:hypothetical protein